MQGTTSTRPGLTKKTGGFARRFANAAQCRVSCFAHPPVLKKKFCLRASPARLRCYAADATTRCTAFPHPGLEDLFTFHSADIQVASAHGNLLSGGFHFLPASSVETPELDCSASGSLVTPLLCTDPISVTQSADGRFPPRTALQWIPLSRNELPQNR